MRFAWATPFNPQSAIGRHSSYVLDALAGRGHRLTVVATERERPQSWHAAPPGVPVLHWRDSDPVHEALAAADICIFQIGNYYDFHYGVLPLLAVHPGVVVFHDRSILDLFLGWIQERPMRRAEAREIVTRLYGVDTAERFFSAPVHEQDLVWLSEHVPMSEWVARRALACVAHAPFYADRLRDACPGPVTVQPLAYRALQPPRPAAARATGPLRLLTVGHVNPNKCIDTVIEALAATPGLRERYHYHVVGRADPRVLAGLEALAEARGVRDRVTFHGEVDAETLQALLGDADVISCLRWPVLEGASASAIEGMLAGRPVVVTNIGFYETLPDHCVLKLRPDHGVEDLGKHLTRLATDARLREQMGRDAESWANETFGAVRYAEGLEQLGDAVAPIVARHEAVQQVAAFLDEFGVRPADPLVERVGGAMTALFAPAEVPAGPDAE